MIQIFSFFITFIISLSPVFFPLLGLQLFFSSHLFFFPAPHLHPNSQLPSSSLVPLPSTLNNFPPFLLSLLPSTAYFSLLFFKDLFFFNFAHVREVGEHYFRDQQQHKDGIRTQEIELNFWGSSARKVHVTAELSLQNHLKFILLFQSF